MSSVTSLRELPIPGGGFDDEDDNRSTSSWDSTYQPEPTVSFFEQRQSLCSHAVSVGSTVFGVNDHVERPSDSDKKWWTWKRSLEHVSKNVPCSVGAVHCLSSNAKGTVIAAATDAGIVALLRGSDGAVLATRNVCSSERLSAAIRLTWIPCPSPEDNPCDALLMEVPIGTEDIIGAESHNSNSQLILVTNIYGARLNHSDSGIVSEAARHTQIIPIPTLGTLFHYDVRAITAVGSTTADIVRLVACDSDSQLVVFDFHCVSQVLQMIQEKIPLGIDATTIESDNWMDFELGFYSALSGPPLVLCSALLNTKVPMLFWFNPLTMQTACQFALPHDNSGDGASSSTSGTKVMAMESVSSWSDSDALAYAVAVKPLVKNGSSTMQSTTNVHIVQLLLDETLGLTMVYCPHLLYTIPIQEPITSINLAAIQPSAAPFSFRFHFWNSAQENSECLVREFQPNILSSQSIGQVRNLIHRKEFDQAEALIAKMGVEALVMEPYANFHPSEVAFHRLQHSWQNPSHINVVEEETQLCLRQLASGAIVSATNNTKAFDLLINAVLLLTNDTSSLILSIDNFIKILKMMAFTLRTVLESIPNNSRSEVIITSLDAILKQAAALKVLTTISAGVTIESHRRLASPFFAVRSIHHLYEVCIEERQFVMAEAVYQCGRNDVSWSATSLVKPLLLNVKGSDVKPKEYLFVISDVIFPNLALNDANLAQLKLWSCQMADSLDDSDANEANLDAAVLLLETVDKGIRELRLRSYCSLHLSVSNDRPRENDNPLGALRVSSNLDNSSDGYESRSNPRASKVKASTCGRFGTRNGSIPTILELSALQRGPSIVTDDDCIHDKLFQAKCIQTARSIGLVKAATSLRSFLSNGGPERLAKDLGCLSLTSASSDESRDHFLVERVQPFCEQFSIDFDHVLHECAVVICCGKRISSRSIEECCSFVRCCSSKKMRCTIILIILRAALSCGGASEKLLQLSKEAISVWAIHSSFIRSELEEAFRLLQIDGIVVRYCGLGARELFRVDNPRHSIRLLHFVTRRFEVETVVDDLFALCDGFNHLCRRKACCQLLENAILHRESDFALQVFEKLINKESSIAEDALAAAVSLAESILEECSLSLSTKFECRSERLEKLSSERASCTCSRIDSLILCALEHGLSLSPEPASFLNSFMSIEQLGAAFTRVQRLQNSFSVFLSMGEMASIGTIVNIVADFIGRALPQKFSGEDEMSQHKLSLAKRVCTLLSAGSKVDVKDIWIVSSALLIATKATEWNDRFLTRFIVEVALSSGLCSRVQFQACMSLLSSLSHVTGVERVGCLFGMRRVTAVASLLKNYLLLPSRDQEFVANIALSSRLEMMCQIFIRCDEGIGEEIECLQWEIDFMPLHRTLATPPESSPFVHANGSIHRTTLHPSWYVGDGILLPPGEAFRKSLRFRREGIENYDVFDLVNGRGAHSLSLRILCETSSFGNCHTSMYNNDNVIAELHDKIYETTYALAERNIGGTGTGITSSAIDSQQAVSFLWILPMKQALDVYKCCLPTALKTRNFERLFILSNIGVVAASWGKSIGVYSNASRCWKKQDILFDESRHLATKTKWWSILQQINLDFDPHRFAERFANSNKSEMHKSKDMEARYAVSLLPSLLLAATQILGISRLDLFTFAYAETFGIPLSVAVSTYIEFLLSPTNASSLPYQENQREERLLELLQLKHPTERIEVLRRCLQKLEGLESADMDYELYNLALRLYHESLLSEIEHGPAMNSISLEAELDAVDRRRDVLAILSAFFQDDLALFRPRFSRFFEPIAEPEGHLKTVPQCGILGKRCATCPVFDPLEEIEKVFATCHDERALTALAPLCIPLQIPLGYIHARALVAKFLYSSSNHVDYPSFDGDILPVLTRIGSSMDKANLVEWCANRYKNNESEKLKCLDALLQNIIQASTEIENRRRHFPNDALLLHQEHEILENIKRITAKKAALSDYLRLKKLLVNFKSAEPRVAKRLAELLVVELDRYILDNPEVSPEALIDFLYKTGSEVASHMYLNHTSNFSIVSFRSFCSIVHSACKAIAEQYSHIDLVSHRRHFVHRWLFYGDDSNSDTAMDLSNEATGDVYLGGKIPTKRTVHGQERKFSTDNSSILAVNTAREMSEYMSKYATLCIAFVMGSFETASRQFPDEGNGKENLNTSLGTESATLKRMGLLSLRQSKKERNNDKIVLERALELLQIAFAKPSVASDLMSRFRSDESISSALLDKNDNATTITFAMRHRALLAASILCPQEALDEIVRCEGFFRSNDDVEQWTLQQCLFGVFVAKEIEEIGLPLPHSDLLQLSSMNFSSYARALWREHRSDDITERSYDRFLLLLVEMSLRNENCDFNFINLILNEMIRRKLHRTLLSCLEHMVDVVQRVEKSQTFLNDSIQKAAHLVSDGIFFELSSRISSKTNSLSLDKGEGVEAISTVERFFVLISSVLDSTAVVCQCKKYQDLLSANINDSSTSKNELASIVRQIQEKADRELFSYRHKDYIIL